MILAAAEVLPTSLLPEHSQIVLAYRPGMSLETCKILEEPIQPENSSQAQETVTYYVNMHPVLSLGDQRGTDHCCIAVIKGKYN